MAITQVVNYQQVLSGGQPPSNPPMDPTQSAIYIQVSVAGSLLGVSYWAPDSGVWVTAATGTLNWSELPAFGWAGQHADTRRPPEPAGTIVSRQSVIAPMFSADVVSDSPIPFSIINKISGATVATGTMPANVRVADAAAVMLTDANGQPAFALSVPPDQPVFLAAIPTNGHASAPTTGWGFSVSGVLAY